MRFELEAIDITLTLIFLLLMVHVCRQWNRGGK